MPATPARLLLAALLLGPVAAPLAQEGTGARISPDRPRPAQLRGEVVPPPLTLAEGIDDPATLLRMAQATLAAGRLAETAELVERAEARMLTRAELASRADQPAMGDPFRDAASARAALARRDRAEAEGLIAAAIAGLDRRETLAGAEAAVPLPPVSGPAVEVGPPPGTTLGPPSLPPPRPRAPLM
jgi:hypothetical protein